jgi:hypothetical protein
VDVALELLRRHRDSRGSVLGKACAASARRETIWNDDDDDDDDVNTAR